MDTKYLHEALRNWQNKNGDARPWDRLAAAEQSAIMRDAQDLKDSDRRDPLTIAEVLAGRASTGVR